MSNASRITALAQRVALRVKDLGTEFSGNEMPAVYFASGGGAARVSDLTRGVIYRRIDQGNFEGSYHRYLGGGPSAAGNWRRIGYDNTAMANVLNDFFVADLNLSQRLQALELTAVDTGWLNLNIQSGFAAGGTTPQARLLNGVVYLKGNITVSGGSWGTSQVTVATLPDARFYPPTNFRDATAINNNPGIGSSMVVNVSGNVNAHVSAATNQPMWITTAYLVS